MARSSRFRVLLVGGGHAMLPLLTQARTLVERGMAVTLLTDHPLLYYSGMVPEYLGGVYQQHQVTIDLVGWCARTGVRFFPGRAVALDPAARTVTTSDSAVLSFDLAAFDVGAVNPGRKQAHTAIPTRPIHRTEVLQRRLHEALHAPEGTLHLAIVGGGAAGVEIALNLTARARAVRPDALGITLFEPQETLLRGFPAGMQAHARSLLEARGATVRTGVEVAASLPDGVRLQDGTHVPADLVLWATGPAGQSLFRKAHLPVTPEGFVEVAQTLQVDGHPYLFAAGDCAAVAGHEALARIGVHAVKQGPVLARNVIRAAIALQNGQDAPGGLSTFRPYPVAPLILSTGEDEGLLVAGRLWLRGRPMLRLKHAVDRRWMRRYQFIEHYAGLLDARAAGSAPR